MRTQRRKYALVFLFALVCGILADTVPANATVGNGPWDVTVAYYESGGNLQLDVRMSLDSDDTFNNYEICGDANTTQNDYKALLDSGFPSPQSGTFREYTWNVAAAGRTNYAITDVFIAKTTGANAGCGTTGAPNNTYNQQATHGLAIRGRGGAHTVAAAQITSCSPHTAQCTFPQPLAAGTNPTADPPSPTCSRTLTDTSSMSGSFTTVNGTLDSSVTSTQVSWGWGDGSAATVITGSQTSAGKYVAQHVFTALSTMPQGGWKPLATVTYLTTGQFGNGQTTITKTCAIRADFLRPNISDPSSAGDPGGSGDTKSTGDTGLDSCLPSGWDLLNPLAFVGSLGCILKYLFIPSSTTTNGLTNLWGDLTTKAPFSVIYEAVTFIPGQVNGIITGLGDAPGSGARGELCGSSLNGGRPWSNVAGANYNVGACDNNAHLKVAGTTFNDSNVDLLYFIHYGSLFILGGLFFYACYRGLAEIMK